MRKPDAAEGDAENPPGAAAPRPEFGERERLEALALIARAVAEDRPDADVTTLTLFDGHDDEVRVEFVPRSRGCQAGVEVAEQLFREHCPNVEIERLAEDGSPLVPRRAFLALAGPAVEILRFERIALNFLQRLSGIATLTAEWVAAIAAEGGTAQLLDTRKTTPGWRALEKYAVRCGGGTNHRLDLGDGVLLKDNHVEILRAAGRGGFAEWVDVLRAAAKGSFVEVEVDSRAEFEAVLGLPVDAILLDNFALEDLRWAVARRNERGREPLLEASGGIRLDTVGNVAATGVDRISVGALTHSAVAVDIGLDVASGGDGRES